MKQTLIDIDNKILNSLMTIKNNKLIISSNSGTKYFKLWQKEYKKLGRPIFDPRMAEELIDYHSLNLILSKVGAYGDRMKRKASGGELGELSLPSKHKKEIKLVEGMTADTAKTLYAELAQTQSMLWYKNNFEHIKQKEERIYITTEFRLTDQGHICHGKIKIAKPIYIDGNALDKVYHFLARVWPKSATAEQLTEYVFGNKDPNKRSFLSLYDNGQKLEIVLAHLRKLGIVEKFSET